MSKHKNLKRGPHVWNNSHWLIPFRRFLHNFRFSDPEELLTAKQGKDNERRNEINAFFHSVYPIFLLTLQEILALVREGKYCRNIGA